MISMRQLGGLYALGLSLFGAGLYSGMFNESVLRSMHLLSFASYLGTSVWISFFSGIIAFRTLPRHMFGRLQSTIFPAYFCFSTVCLSSSVLTSVALVPPHSIWGLLRPDLLVQSGALAASIVNMIWLEPWTTSVMWERHKIERELGTGHEVGQLRPSDAAKANDPRLRTLSRRFGVLHGLSVSTNLIALCAITAHGVLHLA